MAGSFIADTSFIVAIGSGTETKSLPAMQEGDVAILVLACDNPITGSSGNGGIATSGWTLEDSDEAFATPGFQVASKVMGAVPDTEVVIYQHSGRVTAGACQAFRGVDNDDPVRAVTFDDTLGGAGDPDPPSIVAQDEELVVAIGLIDEEDRESGTTAPSGYSDLTVKDTEQSSTTDGATVMMASKAVMAGTEDPGTFSASSTDFWRGVTLAMAPAASGFDGDNLHPISQAFGDTNFTFWLYETTDTAVSVRVSGYFNGATNRLYVGDLILVIRRDAVVLGGAALAATLHLVASNDGTTVDVTDSTTITVTDSD